MKTGRSQSFAKNAGLYGERVGALHFIAPNKETAGRIRSQLSVLQRSEISNPPSYGARVVSDHATSHLYSVLLISIIDPIKVALILKNPELFEEWKTDIRTMAGRIIDMRKRLHHLLTNELKTPGNWDHIVNQIGMFRCVGKLMVWHLA